MNIPDPGSAAPNPTPEDFAADHTGHFDDAGKRAVAELQWLKDEIQRGLDQLDRGEGVAWNPDEMKAKIRARLASKGQTA